ncbi:DUF2512 family protein [Bacillus sp. B15-48]|uniref:DUF2512 family protein n=1 Tax=Bacillus sp. B15-48 TaxID=1548601 RepID=UPI00193F9A03|nr:DUF2512 family protein [Bacillus sp. B15-48]MBM4765479.1 DUF2512 family protein [Bacillus sp. B15-48]
MKNLSVLLLKFLSSLVVFWISFGLFFDTSFAYIASFAFLVTIVSFFIGDRILLPRIGNLNSVVVDFFLIYFVVWIFGGPLLESYIQVAWVSITSSFLIAGSELFVHSYMLKNMNLTTPGSFQNRFAYEFAEEQHPDPRKEK